MTQEKEKPVKVRGGEARKVVEPLPDKPVNGQLRYDPKTKRIYVYISD